MKMASKALGPRYEPEVSDRRATGAVSMGANGWWSADLAVAIRRDDEILLTIRRYGAPGMADCDEGVDLCLRPGDLDALPVLLSGVIAQARRDGVITDNRRNRTSTP
ncbi:MAG: hypothetical protein ACREMZ_14630 [Gemmatimonadales bacterium]